MARTVSRTELARLLGISQSAVTQSCKKKLARALIGNRIDLDHEDTRSLFSSHGKKWPAPVRAPTAQAKTNRQIASAPTDQGKKRKSAPPAPTEPGPGEDVFEPSPRAETSLGELVQGLRASGALSEVDLAWVSERIGPVIERFGTERALRDMLVARKDLELIRKTELENEQTEGQLIYRELVRTQVFGRIEACNRRLLGDLPKTLIARVYALASTDTPPEVAEEVVRDLIGSLLEPMRMQIERVLNAK